MKDSGDLEVPLRIAEVEDLGALDLEGQGACVGPRGIAPGHAAFQQNDVAPGARQEQRRGHTRDAAAHDDDLGVAGRRLDEDAPRHDAGRLFQ